MKLTVILLTAACIQLSARGLAQTVTYSATNVTLQEVFKEVEKQTGYVFFFRQSIFEQAKTVTIHADRKPVEEFMDAVLKDQPLEFKIKNKAIIITEKKSMVIVEQSERDSSLPLVKGKVVNENGEPVDASVMVKGTRKGTTTDHDGYFEINNVGNDATLIVSGIGIETTELIIEGRKEIIVSAKTRIAEEEEVTVKTNYYSTSKRLSTGNIAKVTSKEISNQPVVSPLMALQGRVPGLEISMPANAIPGAAPTIRIRGNNSLRIYGKTSNGRDDDGNYPLYVIDGVPVISSPLNSTGNINTLSDGGYDPLSTINPANIESIEILKDADATSIYGSRGANGVILVTTKLAAKGAERTNIDISAYKGVGQVSKKIELLNTEQYLAMRNEALANERLIITDIDVDLKYWDQNRYTDWQKELLGGTAQINDAQANISGGNNNTSFRIGGSYHKETLIFSNDFGYTRISGNASINHVSTNQRFKIAANINYGADKNNLFIDEQNAVVAAALLLSPNAPELYNDDGGLNWEIQNIQGRLQNTWTNPLASRLNKQQVTTRNLIANANIGYELVTGLVLSSSMGYTDLSNKENYAFPKAALSPTVTDLAFANFNELHRDSWIIEPKVSYAKKIRQHAINMIAGSTWQQTDASTLTINAKDYSSDALLNSLKGAGTVTINRDEFAEYRYWSLYGRLGYNWKEKYLVNITGRRDASSRFAPGKRSGNFGSLGVGWIFSDEPAVQKAIRFLSFGKLRGSYGSNGSDAVADYQFYHLYEIVGINYNGVPGLIPYSLYNPEFVWEATKKLELAVELAFVNNRVGMEISWYRNRSSNQLVNYTTPYTTGFPSVISNFDATVQNTGWEAVFRADPVLSKIWRWHTSFNISLPHNQLLRFDGIESSPYFNKYKVGEPLSIQWLYNWTGIDQQTGLYTFEDENKDGKISDLDRTLMNPTDPSYYGGWNNIIQYRSFELSFLFQFSKRTAPKYMLQMPGWVGSNQAVAVLNRWFAPGDQTDIQRFAVLSPITGYVGDSYVAYLNARLSNYNIQDASFIRIKTLAFSYSFAPRLLQKLKLQQVKLFIQGQNLLTITAYKGLDPETGSGLPPLRMITGGIQLRL